MPSPGRYTFDLAFDKVIKVAAVAHPSLLKVPEDLEVGRFHYAHIRAPAILIVSISTGIQKDGCSSLDQLLRDGPDVPS